LFPRGRKGARTGLGDCDTEDRDGGDDGSHKGHELPSQSAGQKWQNKTLCEQERWDSECHCRDSWPTARISFEG